MTKKHIDEHIKDYYENAEPSSEAVERIKKSLDELNVKKYQNGKHSAEVVERISKSLEEIEKEKPKDDLSGKKKTRRLLGSHPAIAASVALIVGIAAILIATPVWINLRSNFYDAEAKSAGRNAKLAQEVHFNSAGGDISGGYTAHLSDLLSYDRHLGGTQRPNRNNKYTDKYRVSNKIYLPERSGSDVEQYDHIPENGFFLVQNDPLSTFSIDVDTASYSNVRRILNQGVLAPKGAVRIEEMINYFSYDYDPPTDSKPFSASIETAGCPWNKDHRLVRIGIKGQDIERDVIPPLNLVFLIDVSGSMRAHNKLTLVKKSLTMLARRLRPEDEVAVVVYAGASGMVLPPTSGRHESLILEALDNLRAGGSTNGGAGIQLAYKIAQDNFKKDGVNRVILATDGDFNVGVTSRSSLVDMITENAKSGVFFTVLGFGMGNLKDATMENLADKGNGNYAYIDSEDEARKVFVEQMSATLVTIAKDVKIQVEFNPVEVSAYRLIGYENRTLENKDFTDDKKDAGEIGAGHTVTAFYEVVPVGVQSDVVRKISLKYQQEAILSNSAASGELLNLKIRYKKPDGYISHLISFPAVDSGRSFKRASKDFRFAAAVAAFGMILRESEYIGDLDLKDVDEIAYDAKGRDKEGYREEFLELVSKARELKKKVEKETEKEEEQAEEEVEKTPENEAKTGKPSIFENLAHLFKSKGKHDTSSDVIFIFGECNSSGYTFTTRHRLSNKEYVFTD